MRYLTVNKKVVLKPMARKKSLKVDREQFEGIVRNLLQSKPLKRSKVKVNKRKPEKLIPPQK